MALKAKLAPAPKLPTVGEQRVAWAIVLDVEQLPRETFPEPAHLLEPDLRRSVEFQRQDEPSDAGNVWRRLKAGCQLRQPVWVWPSIIVDKCDNVCSRSCQANIARPREARSGLSDVLDWWFSLVCPYNVCRGIGGGAVVHNNQLEFGVVQLGESRKAVGHVLWPIAGRNDYAYERGTLEESFAILSALWRAFNS